MKKIILFLTSMLVATGFVFGMTGCSEKTTTDTIESENSQQQPELPETDLKDSETKDPQPDTGLKQEQETKPQTKPSSQEFWMYINKFVGFTDFQEFKNYYENNFKAVNSERVYLLLPTLESVNGGFKSYFTINGDHRLVNLYNEDPDEPFINPVIEENMIIYSEDLGYEKTNVLTGFPVSSFEMEIDLKILPENYESNNDFTFEFSPYSGKFKWQHAVKIFESNVLIAELYYLPDVDVSQEWLENFLKENLIYLDDTDEN